MAFTTSRLVLLFLYIVAVCSDAETDRQELSRKFSKLTFERLSGSNRTLYLSPAEFRKLFAELSLANGSEEHHGNEHGDDHHHVHNHYRYKHLCCHKCSPNYKIKDDAADNLSADGILKLYQLNSSISTVDFSHICPALVFGLLRQNEQPQALFDKSSRRTAGVKQYLYGIVSTAIVCLASVVGIFLFPLLPETYYNALTSFMSSLAVGTLAGDALLHLIPHAYGLHSHADNEGEHHTHGNECQGSYLMKTLVVILGIYVFYLIDVVTSKLPGGQDASHHHHHHHKSTGARNSRPTRKERHLSEQQNKSLSNYGEEDDDDAADEHVIATQNSVSSQQQSTRSRICAFFRSAKYVQRYAWIVLIADSVHNVADGVTIGAAFGDSIKLGLTTTLAVLLHELPHELGDYAILITSGFTHLQALFFNLVTALTAFIGLLIGFLLSSSSEATQQWTLAAAAGIFLYVALVDLFPLLVPSSKTRNWDVVLYNAGLLLGFAIMFLLAAYEDQLKYSF